MHKILIIDDEKSIRLALKEILKAENYKTDEAADGEQAIAMLQNTDYDIALCDIKMPKYDGMEVLQFAKTEGISTAFIMITAHGNIEQAVEATKLGAFDFIQKPPDLNRLLLSIRNALENKTLKTETSYLKQKINYNIEIVGESAAILELKEYISKIALSDAKVLIEGQNGTGKELVARQIHAQSKRSKHPFIEVNCAAIPNELIESELFGHEKGAFTSAIKNRTGKFEMADNGTIFLDEIGDMSLNAQAKVLRALQERKITKVGGEKDIEVNTRVIAATNKDLKKEIQNGNFREDLYHRLSVLVVKVPPLDDRKKDIPLLIKKFLKDLSGEYKNKPKQMDEDAIKMLINKNWPGNVRELRNVVERLFIMSGDTISKDDCIRYAYK
ncbi:MAG: sigma-54 dependent transcriptional regulator [Cytophagales bacterium]|nr:sigma-54 dependent transcriptional regulator [Cytophagales bacterium]